MNTLTLEAPGRLLLHQTPSPPKPRAGEALVRVHRVGVCGTDLHAYQGKQPFFEYPRILGHELAVEIADAGDGVTNLKPGDRCAVRPYLSCGACIACRRGKPNCCVRINVMGVHVDGGMREWLLVPASNLHPSDRLSWEELAIVEPLSIGAHAVWRSDIEPGQTALVIGAGPIGLAVIEAARARGAVIGVLEVSPSRLDFCRAIPGIGNCLAATDDPLAAIEESFAGELPAIVFDCTGNARSMMSALRYVSHGGKLVYVGIFPGDFTLSDPEFHKRETTLLASRNATAADFERVIRSLEQGAMNTAPWVQHRFTPEAVAAQFARLLDPEAGILKAIIDWQ